MSVASFRGLTSTFVKSTFAAFTQDFIIQQLTETPDGQGGFTATWSTFASVTGFVKTVTAKEAQLDDHIHSEYLKKFSFEYISGINNDMRILYGGDYYNIRSSVSIADSTIWIDIVADKNTAT